VLLCLDVSLPERIIDVRFFTGINLFTHHSWGLMYIVRVRPGGTRIVPNRVPVHIWSMWPFGLSRYQASIPWEGPAPNFPRLGYCMQLTGSESSTWELHAESKLCSIQIMFKPRCCQSSFFFLHFQRFVDSQLSTSCASCAGHSSPLPVASQAWTYLWWSSGRPWLQRRHLFQIEGPL